MVSGPLPADIGERIFEACRANGRVASVISVHIPADRESVLLRDDGIGVVRARWEQTRSLVRSLRSLLPGDCVPFGMMASCADFVTFELGDLDELRDLIRALSSAVEDEPVETAAGLVERIEAIGCFADDGCGLARALAVISSAESLRRPKRRFRPDALSSRHQGIDDSRLSSAAGVLERDIRQLRERSDGAPLQIAALAPTGEVWGKQPEETTRSIAFDIRTAALAFADKHDGAAFELHSGRAGQVGILLAQPAAGERHHAKDLAESLHESNYFESDYYGQWEVARAREIHSLLAVREVPEDSNGAEDLDAVGAELSG